MHYPIINDKKSVIAIFVFVTFFSCQNVSTSKQHVENNPIVRCDSMNEQSDENRSIVHCDSIIYELPEKATNSLLNKIEGKKVSFCSLSVITNENKKDEYTFSFSYDDRTHYTKRDSLLLQKTNTYLKLKDRYYPVISIFDDVFVNIPRTNYYINEFNSCFITVNAQGEILDGFAF